VSKAGKDGLTLAALGVVFGDIGASPLYALSASAFFGLPPSRVVELGAQVEL